VDGQFDPTLNNALVGENPFGFNIDEIESNPHWGIGGFF
jgi:hypothetical protein